jgi:putative nucleotidyltransferase with HDIG domain
LEVINTLIQSAVNPADLLVLFKLIEGITNPAFRNFLWEVLGNPEIGVPFVSSPASLYHHHHLPGDLLAHSLECAHIASGAMEAMLLPTNEREVTLIAALLHDIGKVRTFDAEGKRTLTGVFIDHNDLTLRVLDSELRKLESNYENGAVTLAYLLSWRFERERIPKFPTASLVWVCDCLSASLNLRKMGFENKPDYFHYTELKIGENRLWLNRLN